ncbi:MAG TPA: hypothetical protein VHD91_05415 [Gaiellaceae bacterium]|nr:hypothetical protein [Gaiellaceae bacterium]
MGGSWFTEIADELAQAVIDAGECAAACEALLDEARGRLDADSERRVLAALVAPIATANLLVELVDRPPQLLLACVRACRDTSRYALEELGALQHDVDASRAVAALGDLAQSCDALLDAVR